MLGLDLAHLSNWLGTTRAVKSLPPISAIEQHPTSPESEGIYGPDFGE
jgi:hypothetical protein